MARISLIQPEQASPEVKGFLAFYSSVGRSLERKLYELIYIRVSMINNCHY